MNYNNVVAMDTKERRNNFGQNREFLSYLVSFHKECNLLLQSLKELKEKNGIKKTIPLEKDIISVRSDLKDLIQNKRVHLSTITEEQFQELSQTLSDLSAMHKIVTLAKLPWDNSIKQKVSYFLLLHSFCYLTSNEFYNNGLIKKQNQEEILEKLKFDVTYLLSEEEQVIYHAGLYQPYIRENTVDAFYGCYQRNGLNTVLLPAELSSFKKFVDHTNLEPKYFTDKYRAFKTDSSLRGIEYPNVFELCIKTQQELNNVPSLYSRESQKVFEKTL